VAEAKGASTARLEIPFLPFREIRPLREDPNIRQAFGSILAVSPAQRPLSELRIRPDRRLVAAVRNSRAVVRRTCDRFAPRRQLSSRNSCSKPPRRRPRSIGVSVAAPQMSRRLDGVPDAGILFEARPTCPTPGDRRNVSGHMRVALNGAKC
jgi:hypothetical protein